MSYAVLVTGGAGYIGSHTCKRLKDAGYVPVALDDLSMGHDWAAKYGPLVQGSMGDRAVVERAIREHGVQAVVHFAAFAYVGESVKDPRRYFQNNCTAMLSLLDTSVDLGIERIVFSSSCATYGVPEQVPIPEDHPQRPVSPYGDTKLMGEKFLQWYSGAYPLRHVALRYFNAAGADPDGEIGEVHDPETHLIPNVMHAALGHKPVVELFGTDYPTRDGTAVRDYIHVADLAEAHVRALNYLEGGGESTAVNLGTGVGQSVREVIRAVEEVSGLPVPVREAPRRAGDPPELFADARKARAVLGWEPRYSDLRTIVSTAWAWETEGRRKLGV